MRRPDADELIKIVWDEPGQFDPMRHARMDDLIVGYINYSMREKTWVWEMFSMTSSNGVPEGFGFERTEALAAYEFEKFFNLYMKNTGRA